MIDSKHIAPHGHQAISAYKTLSNNIQRGDETVHEVYLYKLTFLLYKYFRIY